jgi:gamma-glutamyltranspeptidase/glutathione hydrolase
LALILAACGGSNQPGTVEPIETGFFGAIAADEPRAAIVGRDVLIAGGSAADAAVAVAFSLAATLPSSAGLGGGGACLSLDGPTAAGTLFDFAASATADSRIAVPALVRGLAVLHARHGRMPWSQVLGPAEGIARFGAPVSRALAQAFAEAPAELARDPASARIFAPAGSLLREGETLVQLDLATILGQIRQKGGGEFYTGLLSQQVVAAAQDALTLEALRGYLPQTTTPPATRLNNQQQILFAGDRSATAALFGRLLALGADAAPSAGDAARYWVEATAAAEAQLADTLSRGQAAIVPSSAELSALTARVRAGNHERPAKTLGPVGAGRAGATSLYVADKNGLAIACALGLNAPWGTGKVLPGTGILAAPPPSAESPRAVAAIGATTGSGGIYFAGSASGRAAASALAPIALTAMASRPDISALIAQPRVAYDGAADAALVEAGVPLDSLSRSGVRTVEASPLGLANALSCPDELVRSRASCRIAVDPRGAGLAFGGGTGQVSSGPLTNRR